MGVISYMLEKVSVSYHTARDTGLVSHLYDCISKKKKKGKKNSIDY